MMNFIKLKYIHCSKLAKVEQNSTYEEYEQLARTKFQELIDVPFYFMDREGTILEQDILVDFINHLLEKKEPVQLIVAKIHNSDENKSEQTDSTVSVLSTDTFVTNWMAQNNGIREDNSVLYIPACESQLPACSTDVDTELFLKPEAKSYTENMTAQEWKRVILSNCGADIFEAYEKENFIPDTYRKKLVNITCGKLIDKYGIKVPEFAKRNLAEAIIHLFPKAKDPMGQYGYEAFYTNNNGGEGYLSWRLRTIARTKINENITKKNTKRKSNVTNTLSGPSDLKVAKIVSSEVLEAVEFLRNINKEELDAIHEKLRLTYEYRKSLGINILKEFPRFLDVPTLIEHDYNFEHPKINFEEIFSKDIERILDIYKKNLKKPIDVSTKEPGWDNTTKAILAILYMLPPTPTGRNKVKNSNITAEENLIVFKPSNTTLDEIIAGRTTAQPFLVAQGSNKSAITQYNIIVDKNSIPCEYICTSAKAFATLFMSHYVFNICYNVNAETFLGIFSKLLFSC